MQICRTLAGYSYAKADNVRRAMSKKKGDAMAAERDDFIKGCNANGISSDLAEEVFGEMVGFAKYAFNKSHATAYGLISYRTAYLKIHYPAEYFSALLTSVLDSMTKVKEYIADAQKFGVSVLSPDINASNETFSVDGQNIRFGLLAIKNVGRTFAAALISERSRGEYKTFDDFVTRMIKSDINKRTVESMIKCGVFDSLGITRSCLISVYERIIDDEHLRLRSNITGQMDLFSLTESSSPVGYEYDDIPEYPLRELLALEKECSGMYFSGHLIDSYEKHISALSCDSIADIIEQLSSDSTEKSSVAATKKYTDKSNVKVAGIIDSVKTKLLKNGDTMAFLLLEDRYAEIEVIVFAKYFKELSSLLSAEKAVCINGTVSVDEGDIPKILLNSAEPLEDNDEHTERMAAKSAVSAQSKSTATEKRLYIKVESLDDPRINRIYQMAVLNRGDTRIVLYDTRSAKYSLMNGVGIEASEKVLIRLSSVFSAENVVFK